MSSSGQGFARRTSRGGLRASVVLLAFSSALCGCTTTEAGPEQADAEAPHIEATSQALTVTLWTETFEAAAPSGQSSSLYLLNVADPTLTPPYKRRFDVVLGGGVRAQSNVHAGTWSGQFLAHAGEVKKVVDARGYPNLTLSFWRKTISLDNSDRWTVRYSTVGQDGPWTNLMSSNATTNNWVQSTFTLPASAGDKIIWLSFFADFKANGQGVIDEWGYLDDIVLTGGCSADADCSDGIDCTSDTCGTATGVCAHVTASEGSVCHDRPVEGGTEDGVCDGNGQCVLRGPLTPFSHTDPDLAAYWHFDEGTGSTTADATGLGNTAQITNATWDSNGRSGACLYFNGTNSSVSVPDGPWNHGTPATYIAWYKNETYPDGFLIEHQFTGTTPGTFAIDDRYVRASANPASGTTATTSSIVNPAPGIWAMIAVVFTTNEIRVFKDGALVSTTPITGGIPITGGPLSFGVRAAVGDNRFRGWLDEVSVWKRALNDAEIASLYVPTPSPIVQEQGLVGRWTFDEGRGGTAFDSSGQANHAQVTNATWEHDCRSGSCLYFNGTNSVMSVPDGTWNHGTPATYVVWFKSDGPHMGYLMDHRTGDGSTMGAFALEPTLMRFAAIDSAGTSASASYATPQTGAWTMATIVVSPTSIATYQDGALLGVTSIVGGLPSVSGELFVGGRGSTGDGYFKGWVDEISVYDRALTDAEVLGIYRKTGLVGHWTFEDGTGSTATDSSGRGNHGQITAATWDDAGRVDKCLRFDGVTSLVSIPDGTWNRGTPATYVAWYKSDGWLVGDVLEHRLSGSNMGAFAYQLYPAERFTGYDSLVHDVGMPYAYPPSGIWNMATAVVTSDSIAVYRDGQLLGTSPVTGGLPYAPGTLFVGARGSVGDARFKGWIDEVSVYDGALSNSEIYSLYQQTDRSRFSDYVQFTPATISSDGLTWTDAHGSGLAFTASAGASAPTRVTASGSPTALRFSGSQFMRTSLGSTDTWQGLTVIAALRTTSTIPTVGTVLGSGGTAGWQAPTVGARFAAGLGSDATQGLGAYGVSGGLGGTTFAPSTNYVMVWKHGKGIDAQWTVRKNGQSVTPAPISDPTFPLGSLSAYLGAEGINSQLTPTVRNGGSFDIFELKVYPRELTETETISAEQTMAASYGTSASCTLAQPCGNGVGTCTVNTCAQGLVCGYGMGPRFGLVSGDVCWDPHVGGTVGGVDAVIPSPDEYPHWDMIAVGDRQGCGIQQGALYCWGDVVSGGLGIGPGVAVAQRPTRVGNASDWSFVASGANHVCGIRSGELYCWGDNNSWQLGGTSGNQGSPIRVGTDSDWQLVTADETHTCGIRHGGELYCWGSNGHGEIGDGTLTSRSQPTRVGTSSDWTSVSAGRNKTCGIRSGELWCWGHNGGGELGLGHRDTPQLLPVRSGSASDWAQVSSSENWSCGIRSGALYCSNFDTASVFVRIGTLSNWQDVALGGYGYGCGIESGALYCWDWNALNAPSSNPALLGTLTGWTDVDNEFGFYGATCGLRSGLRYCWSHNGKYNYGDGTTVESSTPVFTDQPLDNSILVHLTPDTIGANASTWRDARGSGTTFAAAAGSAAPTLVTGAGGKPAVRFSGAQYMHASLGDTSAWQGITIAAVVTTPSPLTVDGTVLSSGGSANFADPTTSVRWAAAVGTDATRGLGQGDRIKSRMKSIGYAMVLASKCEV